MCVAQFIENGKTITVILLNRELINQVMAGKVAKITHNNAPLIMNENHEIHFHFAETDDDFKHELAKRGLINGETQITDDRRRHN